MWLKSFGLIVKQMPILSFPQRHLSRQHYVSSPTSKSSLESLIFKLKVKSRFSHDASCALCSDQRMCSGGAGEGLPGVLPGGSPWEHQRLPVQPVHHQDDEHRIQRLPADLRLHGQVSRWHQCSALRQHQHRREGEAQDKTPTVATLH